MQLVIPVKEDYVTSQLCCTGLGRSSEPWNLRCETWSASGVAGMQTQSHSSLGIYFQSKVVGSPSIARPLVSQGGQHGQRDSEMKVTTGTAQHSLSPWASLHTYIFRSQEFHPIGHLEAEAHQVHVAEEWRFIYQCRPVCSFRSWKTSRHRGWCDMAHLQTAAGRRNQLNGDGSAPINTRTKYGAPSMKLH